MQDNHDGQLKALEGLAESDILEVIPDKQHWGDIYTIEEEVHIKNGRFKVKGFADGNLVLEGLPGKVQECELCPESKGAGFSYCNYCGKKT